MSRDPDLCLADIAEGCRKILDYTRGMDARQYFGVDLDIVWDLATNRIPDLKSKIEAIRGLP